MAAENGTFGTGKKSPISALSAMVKKREVRILRR